MKEKQVAGNTQSQRRLWARIKHDPKPTIARGREKVLNVGNDPKHCTVRTAKKAFIAMF